MGVGTGAAHATDRFDGGLPMKRLVALAYAYWPAVAARAVRRSPATAATASRASPRTAPALSCGDTWSAVDPTDRAVCTPLSGCSRSQRPSARLDSRAPDPCASLSEDDVQDGRRAARRRYTGSAAAPVAGAGRRHLVDPAVDERRARSAPAARSPQLVDPCKALDAVQPAIQRQPLRARPTTRGPPVVPVP